MAEQIPLDRNAVVAATRSDDATQKIAPDLAYKRLAIVNFVFFGRPGAADFGWVLIDTGVMGTTGLSRRQQRSASEKFASCRDRDDAWTFRITEMRRALHELAENFDQIAVPKQRR